MKYSIDFNSFSEEELQNWSEVLAQGYENAAGKKPIIIKHNLTNVMSGFSNSSDKLREKFNQNINSPEDN